MRQLRQKWWQFFVPAMATLGAVAVMDPAHWRDVKEPIMLVLSVMAGAVLFRLGRGIPPMDTDELRIHEIEEFTKVITTISVRLSIVMWVTGAALICLSLIDVVHKVFEFLPHQISTGVLVFLITFAFCRAIIVVRGDVGFARFQSDIMVRNAKRRKNVQNLRDAVRLEQDESFQSPPNYGGLVDGDD